MDRIEAFTEYGRILQDTGDWLSSGYRQNHPEREVVLPSAPKQGIEPEAKTATPTILTPAVISAGEASRKIKPAAASTSAESPVASSSTLEQIRLEISDCTGCNLYLTRQNTVPGVGGPGAEVMIVTPPPSDNAGFESGPLPLFEYEYLEKWLRALGLDPLLDTFITPAVKCRTPGGRPPNPGESEACSSFLRRQYKEVKPRAVLALGAAACGALTGNAADFPSLVGRDWTWGSVPALVLWTPSEVLASPGRLRAPVWESLQRLKAAWNALPGSQL